LSLRIRTQISCEEKPHEGRAVKIDMLLILDIIFSFTQITSRGGPGIPCHSLTAEGVDTQSKMGNTANGISWEFKEHVFRKAVRRISSHSLSGR